MTPMRTCRIVLQLALFVALVGSGRAFAAGGATPEDGAGAPHIEPGLDVLAGYTLRLADQGSPSRWYHEFALPRARASLDAHFEETRGRLVLEAVRSAENGALTGVGGDSLLLRLREARVGFAPWSSLTFDAGLIPTALVPAVDRIDGHPELGSSILESSGLYSFADLGVTGTFAFPGERAELTLSLMNGEGYTSPERNRGKNVELAGALTPFPRTAAAPLSGRIAYVLGSSGTGRSRADRLAALIAWDTPRLGVGVLGAYAWGAKDDGARRVVVGETFARGEPVPRVLFAARASLELADPFAPAGATEDRVLRVSVSTGYRLAAPLEVFLVASRTSPSPIAEAREPAIARWEFSTFARFQH
jgi:hypothetical protein